MFTGKYPSEVGVHAKSPSLDVDEDVLPEQMSNAGYQTRCWTANPNIAPSRRWDRGFDEFIGASKLMSGSDDVVDWSSFSPSDSSLLGKYSKYLEAMSECFRSEYNTLKSLRDGISYVRSGSEGIEGVPDSGASSIRDRLRETKFGKDEFLYLNLMEVHTPYYTPTEFSGPNRDKAITVNIKNSLGLESPPVETVEAYLNASQYLSSIYKEIFDMLDSSFDYVVTVSDHGEMLGESDIWNHTYGLFPEIVHIPLVISGRNLDGHSNATVSHLDVHKTLLSLAGINYQSRGRNLLGDPKGKPVLTEYHGLIPVAVRRLKEENVSSETIDTFDSRLSGVAMPPSYYGHETNGGYASSGDSDKNPEEVISSLRGSISEQSIKTEGTEMSEEVIDRLDDLGYV
jgi:arylsulfatase